MIRAYTVEEEQSREEQDEAGDSESESEDEGIEVAESESEAEDPIDHLNAQHAVLSQAEQVREEVSPALQDALMTPTHLHLPGFEEVEKLALLLLELGDDGDHHIVPIPLRQKIAVAAGALLIMTNLQGTLSRSMSQSGEILCLAGALVNTMPNPVQHKRQSLDG